MTYGVSEKWLRDGTGAMFDEPVNAQLERVTRDFQKLDVLLQDYVLKQIDWLLEFQDKKGM